MMRWLIASLVFVGLSGCSPLHFGASKIPDAEGNIQVDCSEPAATLAPCSSEAFQTCDGSARIVRASEPIIAGVGRSPKFYQYSATYHCE